MPWSGCLNQALKIGDIVWNYAVHVAAPNFQ